MVTGCLLANLPPGFVIDSVPPEGFVVDEPRTMTERAMRGLGLGVRYLTETPALTFAGLADLGSAVVNKGLEARGAPPGTYRLPTNRAETVYSGFNDMGFPQPENKPEQLSERISRAGVGAMVGPAVGARMATSPNSVTSGVGSVLQQSPGLQGASAVTAAGSGFAAREMGAGPKMEFMAELIGGALGPAAAIGAGRTAANAGRAALGVKDALTKSGQRKIVGNVLDSSATNSERAAQRLAENEAFGPGVSDKTTGAASGDTGLLGLERAARHLDTSGRFNQQLSQANTRRQRILDVIGGEDIKVSKARRDAITGPQREAALNNASPITSEQIISRIDTILASPQGARKVVKQALNTYRKEIEGVTDAKTLYEIRKDINDAMQGKFRTGDRSDFKLANMQLKAVKNAIDDQIEASAPGFKKYLEDYARLSRDIDQRGVIQNIKKRSALAASDPESGNEILSQAKFKNRVNAERDNGVLTDEQLTVLDSIADDLDSGQAINSATVRPPGSDTAKNLTVAHVLGRALGGKTDSPIINNLARPLKWITQLSEEEVQGLLVEAMLDPRLARMLLQEANQRQVTRAAMSIRTTLGVTATGAVSGSAAQIQQKEQ